LSVSFRASAWSRAEAVTALAVVSPFESREESSSIVFPGTVITSLMI
jgi:hypothetical protein